MEWTPETLEGARSGPLLVLGRLEVSRRGGGREEAREGRLGADSALLERIELDTSYFSLSFSQLHPGSTARLFILSMSARLREEVASVAMLVAKEVDGRNDCCCAFGSEAGAGVVGSCERDCNIGTAEGWRRC